MDHTMAINQMNETSGHEANLMVVARFGKCVILDCAIQKSTPMLERPTAQTYAELQQAFDFFNERLFDGQLPQCLLTLQREKRCHGFFSSKRFVHRDGKTFTDEIALNPSFFSVVPPKEIMQTIVHEMVHAWQFHFGNPGRRGYHNQEWAQKMEEIGLMPSHTGQPGGAKTGEKMNDYIIPGGRFEQLCNELFDNSRFAISWYDRFPPEPPRLPREGSGSSCPTTLAEQLHEVVEVPQQKENKTNRQKLRCPNCGNQAWCKPGMRLLCGEDDCRKIEMELAED